MGRIVVSEDIDNCGLTYSQLMELWLGPGPDGSLFDSTEHLRDAWTSCRALVMRLWGQHGRRPQIWWCLDAPGLGLKWPGYDREQSYLFEMGILSEAERAELLHRWRREFDCDPRPAHLDWADVPDSLRGNGKPSAGAAGGSQRHWRRRRQPNRTPPRSGREEPRRR